MTNKILYSLECDHATLGVPTLVSGKLWCPWCNSFEPISGVIEYEWRAKCRGCTFARWAGLYKRAAEVMANGHSRKYPDHTVITEYTKNPVATRTAEKMAAWNASLPAEHGTAMHSRLRVHRGIMFRYVRIRQAVD